MRIENRFPSAAVSLVDAVFEHSALCEEVYAFLLEENRVLRSSGRLQQQGILDKKKMLLAALEGSLARVKASARAGKIAKTPSLRAATAKAQRILLKAMLLDKENEQLLLKRALSSSSGEAHILPKPTANQVRRRYEGQK
jgi:hypothetical protein